MRERDKAGAAAYLANGRASLKASPETTEHNPKLIHIQRKQHVALTSKQNTSKDFYPETLSCTRIHRGLSIPNRLHPILLNLTMRWKH